MPSLTGRSNFVWLSDRVHSIAVDVHTETDRVHTATECSRCKGYNLSRETIWVRGITARVLSLPAAWHCQCHRSLMRLLWQKCYFRITRNAAIDVATRGMDILIVSFIRNAVNVLWGISECCACWCFAGVAYRGK